jgi:hypothetical protein
MVGCDRRWARQDADSSKVGNVSENVALAMFDHAFREPRRQLPAGYGPSTPDGAVHILCNAYELFFRPPLQARAE